MLFLVCAGAALEVHPLCVDVGGSILKDWAPGARLGEEDVVLLS